MLQCEGGVLVSDWLKKKKIHQTEMHRLNDRSCHSESECACTPLTKQNTTILGDFHASVLWIRNVHKKTEVEMWLKKRFGT